MVLAINIMKLETQRQLGGPILHKRYYVKEFLHIPN